MSFYTEQNLPAKYRSKNKDYTHSGYDRRHLANDASFDYDKKVCKKNLLYGKHNSTKLQKLIVRLGLKPRNLKEKLQYHLEKPMLLMMSSILLTQNE